MTAYTPARILPLSSQYGNAEAFVIENAVEFSERHLFPRIRKGIRSSASTDTVKTIKEVLWVSRTLAIRGTIP